MNAPGPDGIVWQTSSYSGDNGDCVEVGWHKSSYSGDNGACVEVGWHKSSYSTTNGDCVEVGRSSHDTLVRDSKARRGHELAFPRDSWLALVGTVRSGSLRRGPR